MVVHVVMEKEFTSTLSGGIQSEALSSKVQTMAYQTSAYTVICPMEALKRIDATKKSFIQNNYEDKLLEK